MATRQLMAKALASRRLDQIADRLRGSASHQFVGFGAASDKKYREFYIAAYVQNARALNRALRKSIPTAFKLAGAKVPVRIVSARSSTLQR